MAKAMTRSRQPKRPSSHEVPVWQMTLDILLYEEGGETIAHCLQTDTAVQARDERAAVASLREALTLEFEEAIRDNDIRRILDHAAPDEVWKMKERAGKQKVVRIDIDAPSLPTAHRSFRATKHYLKPVA